MSVKPAIPDEELVNNLSRLGGTLSLAVNHVQQLRDELVNANGEYWCRFEECIMKILTLAQRLDEESNRMGYFRALRDSGRKFPAH